MNLNDTQLEKIRELSALFLEPEEIAVLADLEAGPFLQEISRKKGPVYKAYFLGKSESKKAICENVIKMARHGSPQAEELAREFLNKQNLAEKRGQP